VVLFNPGEATVLVLPRGDLSGTPAEVPSPGSGNDVLVRMSDGSLRGYKVPCGQAPTPSTPYTKLGTGWNAYNAPRPAT